MADHTKRGESFYPGSKVFCCYHFQLTSYHYRICATIHQTTKPAFSLCCRPDYLKPNTVSLLGCLVITNILSVYKYILFIAVNSHNKFVELLANNFML